MMEASSSSPESAKRFNGPKLQRQETKRDDSKKGEEEDGGYSWGRQKDSISTRRKLEKVRSREARWSKDEGKNGNREGEDISEACVM